MSLATPDITIKIKTSDNGRNLGNPKPDDQVQLTKGGTSIGNGRVTVTSEGNLSLTWVRIGNGKISEGDDISLILSNHKASNGRIIAATDNFLEITYSRDGNSALLSPTE